MPNDKISNLYKTFVSGGYEMESEEEFRKNLSDKDKRKSAYDALVKDGYDMEPFEEFEANLGFGGNDSEGSVSKQVADEYDRSAEKSKAAKSSPYVGKDSDGNVTVFGVPYDEYMKMPKDKQSEAYSNAIEKRKADEAAGMRKYLEETVQLARLDEAERKAQETIDKKGGDFSLAKGMFGVFAIPDVARFVKSRFFDSEARAAYATREKAREAKELVSEAGHAGNGWLDKQVGGIARGVAEGATDTGTWDFGASDATDAYTLNDIVSRLQKGEKITEAEQGLLDVYGLASAVEEAYGGQVGMGYKVGRSLPESAGFMASMAINPASGLAKAAVKKYGTSTVKKIAARVLGDAAEMGAMTVTTGAGRVAEDFYNRMNGSTKFDIDGNGIIRYGGQAEQEQAFSAIFKALGSNFIENYSESLGEYFSPLGGFIKGITSGGLRKAGLGKLVDAVGDIKSSQWSKGIQKFKDKTKFNGFIGEYMEEVAGNFMNAATVGDMNFNSPEDPRSVFNPDTNIETALSCAFMSGTLYAVEAAGPKGGKNTVNRKLRDSERAAEKAFAKGTGNPEMSWENIREGMDKANPEGLEEIIRTIKDDADLSQEQKAAAMDYAAKLMMYQGFNSRTAQNHEEQTDGAKEAEAAYDDGTTMKPEQRYSAENGRKSAGDALRAVDEGLADTIDRLVDDDAGEGAFEDLVSGVDGEEKARLAREYYNASMRVAGVIDNARAEADDEVGAYEESIRPFVYEDGEGNRIVTTALYGDNADEDVHVVANDGTYAAIIRADGTKEMVAADKLRDVQTRAADELVQEYRDNVYSEKKAQTEMSLNNHPKTKFAEPGMVLWNGDNAMIVSEVGEDGTVRAYPAVLDANTGGLSPKNGSSPVDMTMGEALELQNDYYNRMDAAENGVGIAGNEPGNDKKADGSLHPKAQEEKPVSLDETNGPTENGNQPALLGIDSPAVSEGKDTTSYPEKQAESQNSQIELDEKGNPLYHKAPMEATLNDILDGSLTDDEVDGFVGANIKEAESELKKVSDKAPKIGTNKAKYLADKKAWQSKVDEAQGKVDYWKQVQDAVKESRVKPGDKTAEEILAFGEPLDGIELAARELSLGNLPLLHEDYKRELGFGNKEAGNMFGLFKSRENGGLTIEEAGELLMQADLEGGTNFFDQADANAGRNAIIEVLSSARTRGDLIEFIRKRREAMAERERNAEMEHEEREREAWAQENFGMSYEDYAAYQEVIDAIIREKAIPEEAIQEFYNNFTDELNNWDNGRIKEEAAADGRQGDNGRGESGEGVLPEEQAGNAGGTGTDASAKTGKRAYNEGAPAQEGASGNEGIAASQENGGTNDEDIVPTLPALGSSTNADATEVNHGQSEGETVTSGDSSKTIHSGDKGNNSSSNNQTNTGFIAPQPEKGENMFDYAERVVKAKENSKESKDESSDNETRYRSDDAIKDRIEGLFNQSISGELNGKPISIGRLTDDGKKYLEQISGVTFRDNVDFVLNPSDLAHIYKEHFGNNEKDKGQNIPLGIEDIRNLSDVISSPDKVIFFKEGEGNNRNMFYFFKEAEGGTYNLMEIYSDRKGNLTAKTFYKTRKGINQRVIDIEKSLLPTSETSLVHPLSGTKIPKMFETANVDGNNSNETGDSVLSRDSDKNASKEEPKELVAVHNLNEGNLKQALELGGFPMPSIAVTKAGVGHTGFGDISLVFGKESIDPADKKNKVYGEDAWTPTFPEVGYKLDGGKASDIYRRANMAGNLPLLRPAYFHPANYESYIKDLGSESLVTHFKDDYGAKQIYLSETGSPVKRFERKEVDKYPPEEISLIEKILKEIGIERVKDEKSSAPGNDFKRIIEEHYGIDLDSMDKFRANARVSRVINRVIDYAENGNKTTEQDVEATKKKIDERIAPEKYEAWLEDLFGGVVLKKGIRNDKDPFTPSGLSRDWEQLYDDITLDSVVNAMKKQSARGGAGLFNGSIFGASQKELKSIDEIRKEAKERIRIINDEEYEAQRKAIIDRLSDIKIPGSGDSVSDAMDMVQNINDAVSRSHTAKGIHKYLKEFYPKVTMENANDIAGIVKDVQRMSARYFEAKPYRAVGFDEVRIAVVPSDIDPALVQELEQRGIPVRTYENGNEEQRRKIVEEATDEMGIRFREMQDVNERFNEELSGLTEDNADNVELDLGRPSPVLRAAGVEDKRMKLYGNKVIKKMKKHGFKLDELRNLPGAVANPIAVFNNYGKEGNRSILTELKTEQGNFLVTLTLGKGRDIDFNIVTSVFGKGENNIITWINNGYATYINKNKTLGYLNNPAIKAETPDNREGKAQDSLFYQSAPIAATAAESELSDATKIVENFENPNIVDEIQRDGNGNYPDDSISEANDPASKLLGKPARTARQRKEFAERERGRMVRRAENLARKLNLGNVEIVTDASTLGGRRAKAKGFYDIATGKITVVIPNHISEFDVAQTLLHEAVAHYGLRRLFGDNFDTFLDNVFDNADADVRGKIEELAKKKGLGKRTATEEYLASLAEDTNFEDLNAGWWGKIKELFLRMLHKIGFSDFNGATLTDNELRYILWRSHENLANPGRYRNMFDTAADVVKQSGLKVGNYAESGTVTEAAAESDVLFRTSSVDELLDDWGKYVAEAPGIYTINSVEDIDRLPYNSFTKRELKEKLEDKRCTGAYSNRKGAIFLFPGHASGNVQELELTLWHETAHYASRRLGLDEKLKGACLEYLKAHYPETYKEITGYYDRSRWNEEAVAYLFEKKIKEFGAKKLLSSTFAGENDVAETFTQLINFIKNGKGSNQPGRNSGSSGNKSGEDLERSAFRGRGNDVLDERRGEGGGSGIFDDEGLNIVNRETGAAREQYERTLETASYKAQESWQDSMLGLKVLQDAIAKATRSRILDYENAYMAENALSSRSLAEMDAYRELVYKPLLREIAELKKQGAKYGEITDYLVAKHGIERNREMAVRKALAEDGDTEKENIKRWTDEKKSVWNDDVLSWREKQEKLDRIAESYGADMGVDYSGLSSMFPNDDMEGTTDDAYKAVEGFEERFDTAPLLGKVKDATDAVMKKQLESGLIGKDVFDSIGGMYQFYVPLRGWEEKTADEVYDYLTSETSSFNAPIKKARGRKSKADDPIATIANIAESGILQGNRNLMKQKFLLMAENHRSDLVSISDVWLRYDEVSGEWKAVFPEIPEKASPEEVESIVSKFNGHMKELSEKEPDKYKKSSDAKGIPYKILPKNMKEHQVIVKRGGKEYVLTINGNPRAAQALNGLTNPNSTDNIFVKGFEKINRFLAANFTSRNPAFVISNLFRDAFYTNSAVWVKENPAYAMRYNRNWAKSLKDMGGLVYRYKAGKLDMGNPTDRMFAEFIKNGGETGYTFINSVEDYKGIIDKELKRMNRGKLNPANAFSVLGGAMDTFGRWAEDTSRFAAYMTSREEGRSVVQSISDAKEISVNFNKKGAGAKTAGKWEKGNYMNHIQAVLSQIARGAYIFWNAGVQGLTNFGRLAKRNPGKFAGMAASYYTLGLLAPLMNAALASAMGGDGDEDDYYNLPEYVRRNNICIYAGGQWITIPLPIELRAIYGLGELASGLLSGKDNTGGGKLAMEVAKQVSGILPIDVLEGEGGFSSFIPSYVKPLAEAFITNKDWTGIPIYKDNAFNKDMPNWTKAYKGTSPELVELSETLNEWTGGNKYRKGMVDFNPAIVEHLFESYLGGVGTTINQLKKSAMMPFDEDLQDVRNIPVVGRFIRSADDRSVQKRINDEYFDNRERFGQIKQELNGYRKEIENLKNDIFERAKYQNLYNDLLKSEEFRKYVEFEEMEKQLKKMLDAFKVSGDEELERNMYLLKGAMNEVAK